MLKIRLMRIGAKKRPFYRVVAVDERNKRNGAYLELLGTYNPLTNPHEIKLKQDRIDDWVKKGAQMSDGFLRIIGQAPQRPPRKPKKEKAAEAPKPAEKTVEEASAEQPVVEENPVTTPEETVETATETVETPTETKPEESAEEVTTPEEKTEEAG